MKKISYLFLFFRISTLFNQDFLDIKQLGHEQYQDIIINNQLIQTASPNHDSKSRYEVICTILDKYNRPFTMLDIGASQGYYSFRTASKYEAVCVMIEGNNPAYQLIGSQLLDLCKLNTELDNIILLNKMIVIEDLQRLSECEHFDIVLSLNIIHWFGARWKEITDTIISLGDNIIIETPPQETIINEANNKMRAEIENYIISHGAKVIGSVKRHTSNTMSKIYLIEKKKEYLKRRTWLLPPMKKEHTHYIKSTYNEKKLIKLIDWPANTYVTSEWLAGINLVTFMMYNGAYPSNKIIKEAIKKLKHEKQNDWMPNNMVIQGNRIVMIDIDDPNHNPGGRGGGRAFSEKHLNNILAWIDIKDRDQIEDYFWNKIVNAVGV